MSLLRRIEQKSEPELEVAVVPAESGLVQADTRLRPQPLAPSRDSARDLKERIHTALITELDPELDLSKKDEVRKSIETLFNNFLAQSGVVLTRTDRATLLDQVLAEILGYGPIEPLLDDESITEIMVNGAGSVYIERGGKVEETTITFENDEHVMRIIDRIVSPIGRRVDESMPYVDARLPNGSRVNIIIPPLSIKGPTITIRKFYRAMLMADKLIELGTVTPEAMELLKAATFSKLNILISGGTGTGKTTFLNVLSSFIPGDERLITIENAAELQLQQKHVITLESRPPNIEGAGEVTIRDLVINALRMRPERIIVGECRSGEALEMLQAMNTGHAGSMSTLHANSPRDALARLETMCLMAGIDLPSRAIREQVASAIDVIVQLERMRDGSRKIIAICEVQGMEGNVIVMQDIYKFEQVGLEGNRVMGRLQPTGIRPRFIDRIEAAGIFLPPEVFGVERRRTR